MNSKQYSWRYIITHTVPLVFHIHPLQFISMHLFFLLNGIFLALTTPCTQLLFDEISAIGSETRRITTAIILVLLLFTVMILEQLFGYIANFIGESYDLKSFQALTYMLQQKACQFSAYDYEDQRIQEWVKRAENGIHSVINFVNVFMDILINYSSYFLVMIVYLKHIHPSLILILAIIFTTILIEQVVKSKVYTDAEEEISSLQIKLDYYDSCISDRTIAKETRTLMAFPYFKGKLIDCLTSYKLIKTDANSKIARVSLFSNLAVLLEYVLILSLMTLLLFLNHLSAGSFVAIFMSIDTIFTMIENVLCGRLGEFAKHYAKVNHYLYFVNELKPGIVSLHYKEMHHAVKIQHISFSYPGCSQNALNDITMTIHTGETIAIVGENGSGKSTLAKLLLGLYEPDCGSIVFNKNYEPLTKHATSVFQDFMKYPFSLKNNITLSDTESNNDNYNELIDRLELREKVNELPEEDDTQLFLEFGGIDLSGGQWQKVSIGRSLYKKHDYIVLDEPTSAIDPITEVHMYQQFEQIVKGKTAFIITHRLGSVKFADKIAVLKQACK